MEGIERGNPNDSQRRAISRAQAIFSQITDKVSQMEQSFDEVINLREMLRYIECLSDCRSRTDVQELLAYLDPPMETLLTVVGAFLALVDMVTDIVALVSHMALGGLTFTVICYMFIYMTSTFMGVVRISSIGKEIYNVRKAFILGVTDWSGGNESSPMESYKYQGFLDAWNKIWAGGYRLDLLSPLLEDICAKVKSTLAFVLGRRPPGAASHQGSVSTLASVGMDDTGVRELVQMINEEAMDPLPVFWTLHLTALPLNYWSMCKVKELHHRCRDDGLWDTEQGVLRIYTQATFLHLIRFEAAEINKAELLYETIPQLVLKCTFVCGMLLRGGVAEVAAEAGWTGMLLLTLSFLAPPTQLVLSTLRKMEYYFALYRTGREWHEHPHSAVEEDSLRGVTVMPAYSLAQKGFCVLAHALTIGPVVVLAALACSSALGPLALLILFVASSYMFWRPSTIPLYNWYYTWTCILSSLSFHPEEFELEATKNSLATKCKVFAVGVVAVFLLLCMPPPPPSEFSRRVSHLAVIHCSLLVTFMAGSVLLYLDRLWFKRRLGRNFDLYVQLHEH